jgi:hypothetical protein
MEDFEILTDAEQQRRSARARPRARRADLAGIDAEVAARDNALKATLRQAVPVNPTPRRSRRRSRTIDRRAGRCGGSQHGRSRGAGARAAAWQRARRLADPRAADGRSRVRQDRARRRGEPELFERTLRTYLGASVKSGIESLLGTAAKLARHGAPVHALRAGRGGALQGQARGTRRGAGRAR